MESRTKRVCFGLLVAVVMCIAVSLMMGTKYINIFDLSDPIDHQIIFELRLPRVIAAVTSGMTLAASGLLIQTSLNNQLADSSILGFQSGAILIALIVMLMMPGLYTVLPLLAFIGGLVVFLIIFSITKRSQNAVFVIIAGIAVSSVIRSIIDLISTLFAENLQDTVSWINGSLNTVKVEDAYLMTGYTIVLITIAMIVSLRLDMLLLDDEYLKTIGIKANNYRFWLTSLAILLASVSVSFVGTIGFVGLIAPHISRRLVDNRSINLMPTSILVGALLVSGCDLAQRLLFPIYEIPVGITLSMIGGVYLLVLLVRSNHVRV